MAWSNCLVGLHGRHHWCSRNVLHVVCNRVNKRMIVLLNAPNSRPTTCATTETRPLTSSTQVFSRTSFLIRRPSPSSRCCTQLIIICNTHCKTMRVLNPDSWVSRIIFFFEVFIFNNFSLLTIFMFAMCCNFARFCSCLSLESGSLDSNVCAGATDDKFFMHNVKIGSRTGIASVW